MGMFYHFFMYSFIMNIQFYDCCCSSTYIILLSSMIYYIFYRIVISKLVLNPYFIVCIYLKKKLSNETLDFFIRTVPLSYQFFFNFTKIFCLTYRKNVAFILIRAKMYE